MTTVYVVALPWDAYSIDSVRVYSNRKDAEKFVKAVTEHPNSRFSAGTIVVNECGIIED